MLRERVRSHRGLMWMLVVAWMGLMFVVAELLAASQAHGRRDLVHRLEVRTQSGAVFASLYVQDIFAREREQAVTWLTGHRVPAVNLAHASGALGLGAAVLLDRDGRLLQVIPVKPGMLGTVLTGRYPHLAAAVAGRSAVSDVVPSAARGVPVVGFAVPFSTPEGRRVFSGAFGVSKTPWGRI